MSSLSTSIGVISHRGSSLGGRLRQIGGRLRRAGAATKGSDSINHRVAHLHRSLSHLARGGVRLTGGIRANTTNKGASSSSRSTETSIGNTSNNSNRFVRGGLSCGSPTSFFQSTPLPSSGNKTPTANGKSNHSTAGPNVRVIDCSRGTPRIRRGSGGSSRSVCLPSNSVLAKILVGNVSTPASRNTHQSPFPSALEVRGRTVLPGHFHTSIHRYFLVISNCKSLDSRQTCLHNRAFSYIQSSKNIVRTGLSSCTINRSNGTNIHNHIMSGRKRVVTGDLVTNFLNNISRTFSIGPIPIIDAGPNSGARCRSIFSSRVLRKTTIGKTDGTLSHVTRFCVSVTRNVFPIVRISTNHRMSVVIAGKAGLRVHSAKKAGG